MSRPERFLEAAHQFCLLSARLTEMGRGIKCTEAVKPFHDDSGEPPCFMVENLSKDERCDGCNKRLAEKGEYRTTLKRRSIAKARMMRNAPVSEV